MKEVSPLGKSPKPRRKNTHLKRKYENLNEKYGGGLNLFEVEKSPEPFDMMCSLQLHDALIAKKIWTRHAISKKWPNQFRILRKSNDQELIENVLDWYCQNILGRFILRCQSATSFRKKFNGLLAAMEREGIRPKLKIEARAKTLEKELRTLTWPKGSGEQLLFSVQVSLNNYADFYSRLSKYTKPKQDGSLLERIAY